MPAEPVCADFHEIITSQCCWLKIANCGALSEGCGNKQKQLIAFLWSPVTFPFTAVVILAGWSISSDITGPAWSIRLLSAGCRICEFTFVICSHTHTHPFNCFFPGLPRWAGTRKVKPIWILLKQETLSGSGISWAICKSAPRSRQITMPAPHHSVCYRLDALPAAQPTSSKHWRQLCYMLFLFCYMLNALKIIVYFGAVCWATFLWDSIQQFPNVSLFAFIYAFCVCLCFFLLADECYSHSRNVNLGFSGTQKLENALGATLL